MMRVGVPRENGSMTSRATDIAELEKMWLGGEGDDLLNEKAIKIQERLDEMEGALDMYSEQRDYYEHAEQVQDFKEVLKKIGKGRHERALDRYKEFMKKRNKN